MEFLYNDIIFKYSYPNSIFRLDIHKLKLYYRFRTSNKKCRYSSLVYKYNEYNFLIYSLLLNFLSFDNTFIIPSQEYIDMVSEISKISLYCISASINKKHFQLLANILF